MTKFVPMPFSPDMQSANLAGRKSQTRRVLKLPTHPAVSGWSMDAGYGVQAVAVSEEMKQQYITTFPFGRVRSKAKPGDVLWFREKWGLTNACYGPGGNWVSVGYQATYGSHRPEDVGDEIPRPEPEAQHYFDAFCDEACRANNGEMPEGDGCDVFRWRPPMHMPAWACRMWAVVKAVRFECLSSISQADAIAESFESRREFLNYIALRNSHRDVGAIPWVFVYEYEPTRTPPEGWAEYLKALEGRPSKRKAKSEGGAR